MPIRSQQEEVDRNYKVFAEQLPSLLERVWDPNEFRSEVGVRSLSKYHERRPFVVGERRIERDQSAAFAARDRVARGGRDRFGLVGKLAPGAAAAEDAGRSVHAGAFASVESHPKTAQTPA